MKIRTFIIARHTSRNFSFIVETMDYEAVVYILMCIGRG